MSTSRLLSRLAVAACTMAGGLVAIASPADASAPDPLLWSGTVRTLSGIAAGANVVAYARPPARLLAVDGPALVPLGQTTTDTADRFALRAMPVPAETALADDDGWISVMVAAITPAGIALAVDSVAWDAATRRWVSDPAERFAAGRQAPSGNAPASERPAELVIPTAAPPTAIRAAEGHSPDPGSSQTLDGAISLLGFSGSTTATTSETVQNRWDNSLPYRRDLCGSRNWLNDNTRIYSFA